MINGDGCSSDCTVEKNYKCHSGTKLNPSFCQYVGRDLKIALVETQKSEDEENRGLFYFQLQPQIPSLQNMGISQYFFFECDNATYDVVSWKYSAGMITLTVDYRTDLEDREASAIFYFNQLYIVDWPIILNFTVKSDGLMLVIQENATELGIFKYFLLSTAVVAVLLLLVGSWFQRMIGIEVVSALQVIYYLHFTIQPYSPTVKAFQSLSLVGLNNLSMKLFKQNFIINDQF